MIRVRDIFARGMLVVALVLVMSGLAGCSRSAGTATDASATSDEVSENTLSAKELASWSMSVSDKQTRFAPKFPFQAPVIDGDVTVAEVDEAGTHFYRIEVAHPATQVSEWYRRSYTNANWVVRDERTTVDGDAVSSVIEATKGEGAWSRVLVEGDGSSAVVEASVGVGTPPEGVF